MMQVCNERDEAIWVEKHFPLGYKGYAVEVGAFDGISTSNTLALEEDGWHVLCVEPNPHVFGHLASTRKYTVQAACDDKPSMETVDFHIHRPDMGGYSSLRPSTFGKWKPGPEDTWEIVKVPVTTLNLLLEAHQFPRLDFLSVDTEGTELSVLKGLDIARWKPKCMIIESWPWPDELIAYLEPFGYKLRHRWLVNNAFVREDMDGVSG